MTFEEYKIFLLTFFKVSRDDHFHILRGYHSLSLVKDLLGERFIDIGGNQRFPLSFALKNLPRVKEFVCVDKEIVDIEKINLPYPESYFDIATCFEVFEHLSKNPSFAISQINKVLKTGGYLVFFVPNSHSKVSLSFYLKGFQASLFPVYNKDISNHIHTREYSVNEVRELIEAHGFEIIELKTTDVYELSVTTEVKSGVYQIIDTLKKDFPGYINRDFFVDENLGDTIFCVARKKAKSSPNYIISLFQNYSLTELVLFKLKLRKFLYLKERFISFPIRFFKKIIFR